MTEICCHEKAGIGIAIVEDEKDLIKAYERMFTLSNICIAFVAYDGIDAVKKFVECTPKPHVVIMDYRMPIMNCIDAMKEMRKIDPDTKFIFLSADTSVKEEAVQAGATAFLIKPVRFKTILDAVQRLLPKVTV